MYYELSLKVERENIISPPFTDDELPTFTKDSKKDNKHRRSLPMSYQLSLKVEREIIIAPPFADDELSIFTQDSKKITNTYVHCRCPTNFH